MPYAAFFVIIGKLIAAPINLYRYSNTGFEPQFQDMLYKSAGMSLEYLIENCTNEYIARLLESGYVIPCGLFEYDGVFAFTSLPEERDKKYYLNHLTDINISLHIKEFHEDIIVYADVSCKYNKENRMTLKEALDRKYLTIYIPKSSL